MLKTQRFRAHLLSHSLLLFAAPYGGLVKGAPLTHANSAPVQMTFNLKKGILLQALKDTDTFLPSDSLALFTSTLLAEAPPPPLNKQAAQFMSVYLKRNSEALENVKQRSDRYFKIIESVFSKQGLPLELKYLAVVESELKRDAVSHAGAAGPWQLMPSTARLLGLKVSKKNDERKHFYKSTVAASKYLSELYTVFGDWLLVVAAYNVGPTKVYQAMRKAGSRNFWKLQYFLPAETRGHVKRFIGTHYYFEETGSEVTLTNAETIAYKKVLDQYVADRLCALEELKLLMAKSSAKPLAKDWKEDKVPELADAKD